MMHAVEALGHIDSNGSLQINTPMSLKEGNVKVIIMYAENEETMEEQLWLRSVSNNPAFDFLKNPEEDNYSLNDGKPSTVSHPHITFYASGMALIISLFI
ncbi:MAG: hypothetical protein ACR2KZ_05260 [Segetibacter sp.]